MGFSFSIFGKCVSGCPKKPKPTGDPKKDMIALSAYQFRVGTMKEGGQPFTKESGKTLKQFISGFASGGPAGVAAVAALKAKESKMLSDSNAQISLASNAQTLEDSYKANFVSGGGGSSGGSGNWVVWFLIAGVLLKIFRII